MPHSRSGKWYAARGKSSRASLAPQSIEAAGQSAAFRTEDASALYATLKVHEYITIDPAGTENAVEYIARSHAASSVTVTYTVAGNDTPLTVAVADNDITVNVATDEVGAATSTANQVIAAIRASAAANALVYVRNHGDDDGTGVVAAVVQDALDPPSGTGVSCTVTLQSRIGASAWWNVGAFAAKTAVGIDAKAFGPLGDECRWDFALNNPDNKLAISLQCEQR